LKKYEKEIFAMKVDGKVLEPLVEDGQEHGELVPGDGTLEAGENAVIRNGQAIAMDDSAESQDGVTVPIEGTSAEEPANEGKPMTVGEIYFQHRQRVNDKVAQKKAKRKKNKKRKKKKLMKENSPSMSVIQNMDIEETFLFGDELAAYPNLLARSSSISKQIRMAQGREINDWLRLALDSTSGVFFGQSCNDGPGCYIGKPSRMDGHISVIGESGRGKTESIVKPTMLTYQDGSTIVFDFKDDLHRHWIATSKWLGKRCRVFCPDAPDGCSCHYDPLAALKRNNSADIVIAASDLAQTLIPLPENIKDPVWIETAQTFLTGAIIYYFLLELDFPDIMLLVLEKPVTEMIKEIMDDDSEETIFAKIFISKLTDVDPRIISNIGMEINKLAPFVADMNALGLLAPEDGSELLDWYEISTSAEPIDVIISVPESKLDYYKPILRLMANQLIKALEQRPQRTFNKDTELPPILVLMDEFARLGRFPSITNGLMTLRSAGVTFVIFIQSIASLDEIYGHNTARVILDNCTFKVIMGASDVESQQYCSNLVGSVETPKASINENCNMFTGQVTGYNRSISIAREPIIYPHEFEALSDIVVVSPHGYFRVDKVPYYKNKSLFNRLCLQPRHKRYIEEFDRTHAISALPEGGNHE